MDARSGRRLGIVPVRSAGILLWRRARDGSVEVLLGHMGGPLWAHKDTGAWSVPKGEYVEPEQPIDAALREFAEELGLAVPVANDDLVPLGDVRQPSGKVVTVWAGEGDLDPAAVVPGMFTMRWPPGSGRTAEFPEIDRAAWWSLAAARERLVRGQRPFLDRLAAVLDAHG
jgi:predicted NUDIX family NTP pyrophosphohydrolase